MNIITGKELFARVSWRPRNRNEKRMSESNTKQQRKSWENFASLL